MATATQSYQLPMLFVLQGKSGWSGIQPDGRCVCLH